MKKIVVVIGIILTVCIFCPFRVNADSESVESLDSEVSSIEDESSISEDQDQEDSALDSEDHSMDTDSIADAVVSRLAAKSADRDIYYPEYSVHYSDNPRVFIVLVLNFIMLLLIYRRISSGGGKP